MDPASSYRLRRDTTSVIITLSLSKSDLATWNREQLLFSTKQKNAIARPERTDPVITNVRLRVRLHVFAWETSSP